MEYYLLGTFLLVSVLLAFLPYYSRRDILFGYRISEGLVENAQVQRIKRGFVVAFLWAILILTVVSVLLHQPWLLLIGLLIVEYPLYLTSRKHAWRFLQTHAEENQAEKRVVVSTAKRSIGVSPYWFLINVAMIVAAVLITFAVYDGLPERIPARYDFQGNITGYEAKSWATLLMLPGISLIITGLFYYVFRIIGTAKSELSGKNLKITERRSQIFRKATAGMVVYLGIMLNLIFFHTFLLMAQVIPYIPGVSIFMIAGTPVLLLVPVIIVTVKVGQGGSRLKLKDEDGQEIPSGQKELVRDDDQFWKLGVFYYNPDDPSVWVEKRLGFGWTMNLARAGAWVFVLGIILLIGGLMLLPLIL